MAGRGCLLKEDFESIAPAKLAVNDGQHVSGIPVMGKLPRLMDIAPAATPLSEKEEQVPAFVAEEKNNTENLREGTVRNYISLRLGRLETRNRTELAVFFCRTR